MLHQGQALTYCHELRMTLMTCEAYRPCYKGLSNNVATRLMKLKLNSWPNGTEDYVNHRVLNEYIQDTSGRTGVHSRTHYDTRVEKVFKNGKVWKVQTSTLVKDQDSAYRIERNWVRLLLLSQY